ncbi:MAG: beta-ketoacyl synthase chain length factor [Tannerella sp.]|jgi:3-oxoacyl-(acyl-carrier-protein) synthase|nr:beta-ketoacyl synthase chain length factor [Tannerella sp.]
MPIYIQSANQISVQKPLSDEWLTHPILYNEARVSTINPDFKAFLSPLMSRRMCNLLKRAVTLSRVTLKEAQVEMPDAIISGTGLGCIENTEKFLSSISENDEKFLQPTFFMQSTHNILSSTIAIELKCHGYNNTFVHRGASFENALLDAMLQFETKKINHLLLGGYDELTDDYYIFFNRLGTWDFQPGDTYKKKSFAAEAAVNMLLANAKNENTLCEINAVELMYRPTTEQIEKSIDDILEKASCKREDIDVLLTGINTIPANDTVYDAFMRNIFGTIPVMQYKHIFGESWSSSALSVYAAAKCLKTGVIPGFMLADSDNDLKGVKRILCYNHSKNKSHSLILLSSCSN